MNNALRSRRAVAAWLFAVAALILAMVVIGGLTRLTGSGLSITEWKPIMGAIPPLTDAAWMDAFARYRQIPQYAQVNSGMTLAGFKSIFWWEWSHRFLGRFLGFAFLVPFLWFAATGAIRRADIPRMALLFALGGLQGLIGWWMVASGLEVRVSVSQYRLAVHLGAALLLLGAMVWTGLDYLRDPAAPRARHPLASRAAAFAGLVYVQILLGALVAGLHAGLLYNTWPSMDGRVFPEGMFAQSPWWINFFENPGTAQFTHRIGAYAVAVCAFLLCRASRKAGAARRSANAVLHVTAFQIVLGIGTLMMQAPLYMAALHQITAAALFCAAIWHAWSLRNGA